MISQAIIYNTGENSSISPLTNFAGVPLIKRAILCGKRAGIKKFFLLESENRKEIEDLLQKDSRIASNWEWFSKKSNITCPVLYYGADVILKPQTLIDFCKEGKEGQCALKEEQKFPLAILSSHQDIEKPQELLESLEGKKIESFLSMAAPLKKSQSSLLYASQSPLEGTVDVYFNRPVGRLMTIPIARARINPNFVSIVSVLMGLTTAILFFTGRYWETLIGAILLQCSAILDCIDGDIARLQFKESNFGKWLDMVGDNIVHLVLFSCLAIREYHLHPGNTPVILGLMLVGATIISFALVVYVQTQLGSDVFFARLQKFIEKMTSRDFTVLLLAGAIYGDLYWFLWLSAIGSQVFWLLLSGMIIAEKLAKRGKE